MRLIFLDTETTGLKTGIDRVIELGMVEMIDWQLTGRRFHSYFNTTAQMNWAAQKVHGISKRFLADKPWFDGMADEINDFIGDSPALVHNASFDQRMYNAEMGFAGREQHKREFKCTLKFSKGVVSGGCKLDDLIRGYLPGTPPRGNHSAMEDADILARVFLAMRERHEDRVMGFLTGEKASQPKSLFAVVPQNKEQKRSVDLSSLAVNAGVREAIQQAIASGSDDDLLAIRTGRDGFSGVSGVMAAEELARRGLTVSAELDDLGQSRRDSALRMMLRGLNPELALRRERLLAEKYDNDFRF